MSLFKRRKLMILFVALFLAGCFLFSLTADAAGIVPCGRTVDDLSTPDINEADPCTLCHLIVGIHRIIEWGFRILTFVAIAALVAAGIIYIVSAGNEKLMETAKTFAKYTLMGFAIVLGAWLIVNYSMILLSKKPELGIGVEYWNKFECDTESDLGKESDADCVPLGGVCSREPDSPRCCEGTCLRLAVRGGVPTYTCQNTSCAAVGSRCDGDSECCSGYCDFTGVVPPQKGFCHNSPDAHCEELERPYGMCVNGRECPPPLIPYTGFTNSCGADKICCKKSALGPEKGGYILSASDISNPDEQWNDRSATLAQLLSCMKDKLPEGARVISSISDSSGIENCVCEEWDNLTCAHSKHSCHYGGHCCEEKKSYAVDFKHQEYHIEIKNAAESCNANYVGNEGDHIHVSAKNGCGCN